MKEYYQDKLFVPGHRFCPGCAAPIAVKAILKATGANVILVSPTGCLEVCTSPYPYSAWGVPWVHSLFENAPAVAVGVEAALKVRGRRDVHVVVIGGDGSTYDIGLGALSGMFERGHNILYICYNNEAYMNTGVQRSGATPYLASTMTTRPGLMEPGNMRPKKNLPAIALAHGIPYVATASVAFPQDITRKVERALNIAGPKYIEIHTPCPIGWGFDTALSIEVARKGVLSGLIPLYETGPDIPLKVRPIRKPEPVTGYLKLQGRFKHLFSRPDGEQWIAEIQAIADDNIRRLGLVSQPSTQEADGIATDLSGA
jgi:pyruvate ferredoxin oxidoreductase beta subunit